MAWHSQAYWHDDHSRCSLEWCVGFGFGPWVATLAQEEVAENYGWSEVVLGKMPGQVEPCPS